MTNLILASHNSPKFGLLGGIKFLTRHYRIYFYRVDFIRTIKLVVYLSCATESESNVLDVIVDLASAKSKLDLNCPFENKNFE